MGLCAIVRLFYSVASLHTQQASVYSEKELGEKKKEKQTKIKCNRAEDPEMANTDLESQAVCEATHTFYLLLTLTRHTKFKNQAWK